MAIRKFTEEYDRKTSIKGGSVGSIKDTKEIIDQTTGDYEERWQESIVYLNNKIEETIDQVNTNTSPTLSTTSTNVFAAALSSATQNTNADTSFTWTSTVENATYITYDSRNAYITLAAGEYNIAAEVYITDGASNNRSIFTLHLDHANSSGTTLYQYGLGGTYIRDDYSGYDSGGIGGAIRIIVAANDRVTLKTIVRDSQDSRGNNYADQSSSRIKIDKITYSIT